MTSHWFEPEPFLDLSPYKVWTLRGPLRWGVARFTPAFTLGAREVSPGVCTLKGFDPFIVDRGEGDSICRRGTDLVGVGRFGYE